jgi:chorismate-pyruvate lyase
VEETAAALGIAGITVMREARLAEAWLRRAMRGRRPGRVMTTDRWRQIEELFTQAVDVSAGGTPEFSRSRVSGRRRAAPRIELAASE